MLVLVLPYNSRRLIPIHLRPGFDIDVYRENEVDIDDVDLEEFSDEIDAWIIGELKSIGCDTARSVLEIPKEDLVKRTDLEEETVEEVLRILKEEFE